MNRAKRILGTLLVLLLLAAGLAAWVMLPWQGVLLAVVLLAAWLLATRRGRQAMAVAGVGIASLAQRWGASTVIVVGIAGVVAVLVAMLAMAAGFEATLNRTGSEDTAIILRGGSMAETNSVITRDQVPLVASLPGIARGADARWPRRNCRRWSTCPPAPTAPTPMRSCAAWAPRPGSSGHRCRWSKAAVSSPAAAS